MPESGKTRDQSNLGQLGKALWKVLVVRGVAGWSLSRSHSLISALLPPPPREIMFPWGMKKHPFVQALIAMLLCQVNEWQAGAAAGHSQCQAAQPTALGQSGPAGLGALPTSAPRWGPSTGTEGERSHWRERKGWGPWEGLSHSLKLIHLTLPFPSPPSCFSDCQHQ